MDEFKQDATAQVVERGNAVGEMAERLGISTKSFYTWKTQFSKLPQVGSEVVEQTWTESDKVYGYRKLTDDRHKAARQDVRLLRDVQHPNTQAHQQQNAVTD